MKSDILHSTITSTVFTLDKVQCPVCGSSKVEEISEELLGNKLFDAKNEKFYRCKGKREVTYKAYVGEWDGKRQYLKKTERVDCDTEFMITKKKRKKEVKRYGQISFL